MHIEAVREDEGFSSAQMRFHIPLIDFGLGLVGKQDHDDVRFRRRFGGLENRDAGRFRFLPGGGAFAQAHDHVDAAVFQVLGMGVALASEA